MFSAFRRAVELFAEADDHHEKAVARGYLGILLSQQKRRVEAAASFREAAELFLECGCGDEGAYCHLALGNLQLALDKPEEAQGSYTRARDMAAQEADPTCDFMASAGLLKISMKLRDLPGALEHVDRAQAIAETNEVDDYVYLLDDLDFGLVAAFDLLKPGNERLAKRFAGRIIP